MLDTVVKLQMLQERFKSETETAYVVALRDALERINGKIIMTDGIDEMKRLKYLKAMIEKEVSELYTSLPKLIQEDMAGWIPIEHRTLFEALNGETGIGYAYAALPKETIKEIIKLNNNIQIGDKSYTIGEMLATSEQSTIDRFKQIVGGGLGANESSKEIARRLKDTSQLSLRQLQAVVHTSIGYARDQADIKVYEEFDDVITGWQSVSVLDSSTTFECASLDGVRYMKPKYTYVTIPNRPLRHFRCRTKLKPLTKFSDKIDTTRAQNGDTKGQISSKTKFPQWFGNQSASFQKEWLGKSRYELYKSDRLDIKDFTDVKSGDMWTLKELQDKFNL